MTSNASGDGTATTLDITVRAATGAGRTSLAAFDHALLEAGAANFNLVTLSSVIPAGADVRMSREPVAGEHGDRLYCVLSAGYATQPGETVWAGLGWSTHSGGQGLFVEHHAGSEESVVEQIQLSLEDMSRNRGGGYGDPQAVTSSVHYVDQPVCALVIAVYQSVGWGAP